jgi:predicted outer membrane repeat protein
MKASLKRPFILIFIFSIVFLTSTYQMAQAELWQVQTSGTRTSGPSIAGDWSLENCYPTLAAASQAVADGDSILLFNEPHSVNEALSIPAFLGNMNLDDQSEFCTLNCGPATQLTVGAGGGVVEVRGITIAGDGADSDLAAFRIDGSGGTLVSVLFQSCLFMDNTGSNEYGPSGSCIDASDDGVGADLYIVHCRFVGNASRGFGGAVVVGDDYRVSIENSEFFANESQNLPGGAAGRGGALFVLSPNTPCTLTVTDCLFSGNQSTGPGGAIFTEDASVNLVRTEITDNHTGAGGNSEWVAGAGVLVRRQTGHFDPTTLTVDQCSFSGNIGNLEINPWAGDGGGLVVRGATDRTIDVSITDSEFRNNFNAQGSGVYVGRFATGTIERCRFHDNTAFLQGGAAFKGGIYPDNIGETLVFEYCEFVGNQAGLDEFGQISTDLGWGGAFCTRLAPRAEFYNCTFVDNVAHGPLHRGDAIMHPQEWGIFDSDDLRCMIVNSVFYGTGNDTQIRGDENAFSLVSNNSWEEGEFYSIGSIPVDTIDLTEFPFFSLDDLHLPQGSLLIDRALDVGLTMDMDGNPVPNGTVPDIGAYESEFAVAAVSDLPFAEANLKAWPNPFNPRTNLSYELKTDQFVVVEIFDVQGRRVSVLKAGNQSAGSHQLLWDGTDERGRGLPSGIYHALLRIGGESHSHKLTLVR